MMSDVNTCRAVLAHHSKSFRLAARLLTRQFGDDAAIVYAWCRRCDDAVDERPATERPALLDGLRRELDRVYGHTVAAESAEDVTARALRDVVRRRAIPYEYPAELLAGMAMDVQGQRYESLEALLLYCHRMAGVVGLMMCHVMGLNDTRARMNAAHLGIAMQLTNICRDVDEDWRRGRLYLPMGLLEKSGMKWLSGPPSYPTFPHHAIAPRAVVATLLAEADRYYRSSERGLQALDWRCALAVRTARRIYAAIGDRIAARGHDVLSGRVVVSRRRKLLLLVSAICESLFALPAHVRRPFERVPLESASPLRFPDIVLPALASVS